MRFELRRRLRRFVEGWAFDPRSGLVSFVFEVAITLSLLVVAVAVAAVVLAVT